MLKVSTVIQSTAVSNFPSGRHAPAKVHVNTNDASTAMMEMRALAAGYLRVKSAIVPAANSGKSKIAQAKVSFVIAA
jgi:hypothetical protein